MCFCACCRQKRLNPFEGLRMQQYKAAAKEADAAARPAAAQAAETPVAAREGGREPAQQAAALVPPAADGQPAAPRSREDNLRWRAGMHPLSHKFINRVFCPIVSTKLSLQPMCEAGHD